MPSQSLTVDEYASAVIRKYLHHGFDEDNEAMNVSLAAEEVYVLSRKLMDAAGGKSEDSKKPLKAIRDGIGQLATSKGIESKEVDDLFKLLHQIGEVCENHINLKTDPFGGNMIGHQLQYRLARMILGDAWDDQPALKLRTMKLVFDFAKKESKSRNENGSGTREGYLRRTFSLGRSKNARDGNNEYQSSWTWALSEIGKMSGFKMLPLLVGLLEENANLLRVADSHDSEITKAAVENIAVEDQNYAEGDKMTQLRVTRNDNTYDNTYDPLASLAFSRSSDGLEVSRSEKTMENEFGRLNLQSTNKSDASSSHEWEQGPAWSESGFESLRNVTASRSNCDPSLVDTCSSVNRETITTRNSEGFKVKFGGDLL